MKKLLAFVLVAGVMITLGLAGCKGKEESKSKPPSTEHPTAEHPE